MGLQLALSLTMLFTLSLLMDPGSKQRRAPYLFIYSNFCDWISRLQLAIRDSRFTICNLSCLKQVESDYKNEFATSLLALLAGDDSMI